MKKSLYKVVTHLRDEYRWAKSERQALRLVARDYMRRGCDRKLVNGWRIVFVKSVIYEDR